MLEESSSILGLGYILRCAEWGGVSVKLVIEKSGSGVRLVVAGSGESQHPGCAERSREVGCPGEQIGPQRAQRDTEGTANLAEVGRGWMDHSLAVPWMMGGAEAGEWWIRMRGNPKRLGEISQAAFLLEVEMRGYGLAVPWGDSEKWDFVVWSRDGRVLRVQVKGTGRLYNGGYEVQPVRRTRSGKKVRYTKKDIDVIAAHVQPLDVWYLIPIEAVGRAKSLRFYPEGEKTPACGKKRDKDGASRRGARRRVAKCWEQYREAWEVLGTA